MHTFNICFQPDIPADKLKIIPQGIIDCRPLPTCASGLFCFASLLIFIYFAKSKEIYFLKCNSFSLFCAQVILFCCYGSSWLIFLTLFLSFWVAPRISGFFLLKHAVPVFKPQSQWYCQCMCMALREKLKG